jgi:hypothetical protein
MLGDILERIFSFEDIYQNPLGIKKIGWRFFFRIKNLRYYVLIFAEQPV